MDQVRVTLTIADPARFEAVLAAARAKGLRVIESFPGLGVATGEVAADGLAALRGIAGISSVEPERGYRAL